MPHAVWNKWGHTTIKDKNCMCYPVALISVIFCTQLWVVHSNFKLIPTIINWNFTRCRYFSAHKLLDPVFNLSTCQLVTLKDSNFLLLPNILAIKNWTCLCLSTCLILQWMISLSGPTYVFSWHYGHTFQFMLFAILSSETYSTSWGILLGIKL